MSSCTQGSCKHSSACERSLPVWKFHFDLRACILELGLGEEAWCCPELQHSVTQDVTETRKTEEPQTSQSPGPQENPQEPAGGRKRATGEEWALGRWWFAFELVPGQTQRLSPFGHSLEKPGRGLGNWTWQTGARD